MIGLGFIVLSVALLSGVFYIEKIFDQRLVHKTVLSVTAWIIFGILLFGRWRFGWRGRTAIRWTISGFVLLMLFIGMFANATLQGGSGMAVSAIQVALNLWLVTILYRDIQQLNREFS